MQCVAWACSAKRRECGVDSAIVRDIPHKRNIFHPMRDRSLTIRHILNSIVLISVALLYKVFAFRLSQSAVASLPSAIVESCEAITIF
jgi:hypothetical protein